MVSIRDVVDETIAAFGSLRILVANAGINLSYGPFEYMSAEKVAEDAQKVIGVNLVGAIKFSKVSLWRQDNDGRGFFVFEYF